MKSVISRVTAAVLVISLALLAVGCADSGKETVEVDPSLITNVKKCEYQYDTTAAAAAEYGEIVIPETIVICGREVKAYPVFADVEKTYAAFASANKERLDSLAEIGNIRGEFGARTCDEYVDVLGSNLLRSEISYDENFDIFACALEGMKGFADNIERNEELFSWLEDKGFAGVRMYVPELESEALVMTGGDLSEYSSEEDFLRMLKFRIPNFNDSLDDLTSTKRLL